MDRRIEALFKKKFPKMFRDLYGDMTQTCMAFGIENGNGWARILWNMCLHVQWHIDQRYKQRCDWVKDQRAIRSHLRAGTIEQYADTKFRWSNEAREEFLEDPLGHGWKAARVDQVVFQQIKEKFGTFRIYYSGGDDFVRGLVDMTESMSSRTCEICGKPGKLNRSGWRSVHCSKHRRSENG